MKTQPTSLSWIICKPRTRMQKSRALGRFLTKSPDSTTPLTFGISSDFPSGLRDPSQVHSLHFPTFSFARERFSLDPVREVSLRWSSAEFKPIQSSKPNDGPPMREEGKKRAKGVRAKGVMLVQSGIGVCPHCWRRAYPCLRAGHEKVGRGEWIRTTDLLVPNLITPGALHSNWEKRDRLRRRPAALTTPFRPFPRQRT